MKEIESSQKLAIFRGKEIRKIIHNNEWWFVINDVITVLTDSADPAQYFKRMKSRDFELKILTEQGGVQFVPPLRIEMETSYANATTTICHSGTPDIPKIAKQADVLIAAIGVPEMIDETYVKPGAVVIDVGINRVEDDSEKGYKLVGDVNFESVNGIASAITPVPGGVGPMTIAMLVENTVEAAEQKEKQEGIFKK